MSSYPDASATWVTNGAQNICQSKIFIKISERLQLGSQKASQTLPYFTQGARVGNTFSTSIHQRL